MKRLRLLDLDLPALVTALIVSAFLTWIVLWSPFTRPDPALNRAFLGLRGFSASKAMLGVMVDRGHGYSQLDLARGGGMEIPGGTEPMDFGIPAPAGQICGLQLLVRGTQDLAIAAPRLVEFDGRVLASFSRREISGSAPCRFDSGFLHFEDPGAGGMLITFALDKPVFARGAEAPSGITAAGLFASVSLLLCLLLLRLRPVAGRIGLGAIGRYFARARTFFRANPRSSLLAFALLSAVIHSYPVVFFHRSIVSPNTATSPLYGNSLAPPNRPAETPDDIKGADLAGL